MNDTLKAAGRIGTELGAAKAENEKLRGLLQQVVDCQAEHYGDGCGLHLSMITLVGRIKDALSQQPEPTDAFTAVDMATAAAQGFRDGQAAVEQAPAQDERDSLAERMRAAGMLTIDEMLSGAPLDRFIRHAGVNDLDTYGQWLEMKCREFLSMQASRELEKREDDDLYEWVLAHAAAFQEARINFNAARPAQTEQRPWDDSMVRDFLSVALRHVEVKGTLHSQDIRDALRYMAERYAAPIAQTAPHDALYAPGIAEQLERTDWTPEEALRWYAEGKHFDTVNGRTRIIDSGAIASNALKHLSLPYLEMKGDAELSELRTQAAPQPEQSGKFAMHQRVRKTSGSEWQGRICGTYSTALTPEGYAVESEAHAGSVQIYPAKALEAVE